MVPRRRPLVLCASALAAALAAAARADEHALSSSSSSSPPPSSSSSSSSSSTPTPTGTPSPEDVPPDLPAFLFEAGAYYSSIGLYLPLTRDPVPHVGEHGEIDLYWALLPRSPAPRFVVLEASVNPMPCLGLLVRSQDRSFYDRTQLDESTNLVRAVTAGFDEPWAASVFVGNVVDFDVRGRADTQGKGYFGIVLSAGNWHIKDNVAVDDPWLEAELKLKGDRRSPVKKLSWSFRIGTKLHSNAGVVDTVFAGIRRSRVDHVGAPWGLGNSGIEYRFDAALDGTPLRHFFLVDKKWPLGRVALSLALGVLWDRGRSYVGRLAADSPERVQVLFRPNVEF